MKYLQTWEGFIDMSSQLLNESKAPVLYHYTDGDEPIISTKKERLIPNSLSASANRSDWSMRGKNRFKITLPPNPKVLVINNKTFWDYGEETDTPLNRGLAIYREALRQRADAVFLDRVGGQPAEWAILTTKFNFERA